MDPSYKEIAELFGLEASLLDQDDTPADRDVTQAELGQQRLLEGQFEKAIAHFRRAVEESGDRGGDALLDLAAAYSAGDMTPQAYRQYLKAKKANDANPEPHLGLSDVLRREGRIDESLQELERVVELEPTNGYPHFKMAEIYHDAGYRERALVAIQKAIFVAPDQSFYHYWMADLLIEMKRFEEAVDALRAAVELSPGDDHLYVRTAVAFWGAGRQRDAIKAASLASELNTTSPVALAVLYKMHRALGEDEEADVIKKRVRGLDDYDNVTVLRILREAGIPN